MNRTILSGLVILGLLWTGLAQVRAGQANMPEEAMATVKEFDRVEKAVMAKAQIRIREIQDQADHELGPARQKASVKLQALQEKYTKLGRLDEAVALRDTIRRILGIRPDPGVLHLTENQMERILLFEVRGSTTGSIWGDEVYTSDSHLGTAAVHTGVLKPGQKGMVKVRVLPGQDSYRSSTQFGITSAAYGAWGISFTVESVRAER